MGSEGGGIWIWMWIWDKERGWGGHVDVEERLRWSCANHIWLLCRLAPYERRVIELLRNSKDKRARKLAKKRVSCFRFLVTYGIHSTQDIPCLRLAGFMGYGADIFILYSLGHLAVRSERSMSCKE